MKRYSVYKHTFPNGKTYVGLTCQNPLARWQKGDGYKNQPLVFKAIKKYGWCNIKHEVVYSDLTLEEAHAKEIEMIALHKSNNPAFGYNIASGGFSGAGHLVSADARKRIGDSHRGTPLSKEHRAKLRKPHYGKCRGERSEEWIKHLKESSIGRPRKPINQYAKTGEFLQKWKSVIHASNTLGIAQANLISVCKGKRKSAGGFLWMYADGGG